MSSVKRSLFQSPPFGRLTKKLRKNEKQYLDDPVLDILKNPEEGEPKSGDLKGIYVYKLKMAKKLTLLSYEFDDDSLTLLFFGSHENFIEI